MKSDRFNELINFNESFFNNHKEPANGAHVEATPWLLNEMKSGRLMN